jgi:diaminopimelate decarboxylase
VIPAALAPTIAALVEEHGSPLWLVDVDRVRANLHGFRAAWEAVWPDVEVAYSYKTNRTLAILRALADEGAAPEVVCAAEYALARDVVGAAGDSIVLNGPVKPPALLERAAADGALVIADGDDDLRAARAAGVRRLGLRVRVGDSRFGFDPTEIGAAARAADGSVGAAARGSTRGPGSPARAALAAGAVEALSAHVVSTSFTRAPHPGEPLAATVRVDWPPPPEPHARAAALLARLACEHGVGTVDLGGSHPAPPRLAAHAAAVADALRAEGFAGRLLLEPGRALVADAVDLATTVVAVKDGLAILDAGTNLLPGVLWGWPRFEAVAPRGDAPVALSGPLCLNVDVLHPAAPVGPLAPGDLLLARAAGAYQQVQSTQFGDFRPAVAARDGGRWRLAQRRESIEDLVDKEDAWVDG